MKNNSAYQNFLAEREQILRYKWLESEKRGYDIAFEQALVDWATIRRASWQEEQKTLEEKNS